MTGMNPPISSNTCLRYVFSDPGTCVAGIRNRVRRPFISSYNTPLAAATRGSPSMKPRSRSKRSEEHTSELQSLMRISYAVFCLKKKNKHKNTTDNEITYNKVHTSLT